MDLRQENVLLKNKLKAVQKGAELEQQPWEPSPKKQKIMTHGTATLFAGEKILVGLDSFKEIVNQSSTIINKTLLISKFIECKEIISLVIRPRQFGKTINLTMLRKFFSIPIHPDNKNCRYELFKDTKIMERSDVYNKYFCKYPVIFLSLKNNESCSTWSSMQTRLCQQLATLYNDHHYVYYQVSQKILNKSRFDKINSGKFKDGVTKDALLYLFKYLKDYHRNKCIVLIDEYDHPLEVAYQHQYYEEARGFFASLFGALLKGNNENLEKALLVGVSRVAKSGYLSELNNLKVFPMHHEVFANYFGFTENEIFMLLQHNGKENQLDDVRQWYNGYRAGNSLNLYNLWSINSFINEGNLKAHWIDTGGTKTIKDLLWNSTEDFKNNTSMLLKGYAINVRIMEDMDYNMLAQKSNIDNVLWTLLYYAGYLTKDKNDNLCIPNMEEQFSRFIMNSLSYYDVTDKMAETNYHVFIIGLFNQAYCRGYKLISNREAGTGRFDLKIEPTEKVNFKTGVFMEFKVLKNEKQNKKKLQDKANEALEQIKNKRYFSDLPKFTKQCVICGVAFQGKDVYIASEVLNSWQN
uniref:AAA-ATPase-like domain-containing protein n=1 Tax=Rhizophagus irregularis (strain DAOM 181602 / DAOM 197198 / MUCL 43194) TaxID=747089 RepID=U9TZU7_RHIID